MLIDVELLNLKLVLIHIGMCVVLILLILQ